MKLVELVECRALAVGDWFLFDGSETPVVIHRLHRHGSVVDVWLMAGGERVTLPAFERIRKIVSEGGQ